MKVCILKDEDTEEILNVFGKAHKENGIESEILLFDNVLEQFKFSHKEKADLVIMNEQAEYDGLDSYDLARRLKIINKNIMPIIITKDNRIDVRAGRAELFGFLLPEAIKFQLPELLKYAQSRITKQNEAGIMFCYQWNGSQRTIKLEDVIYFCSNRRLIEIKGYNGADGAFYQKLDEVEKAISKESGMFLRVSKSYYINKKYITALNKKEIQLKTGEKIPITRKYYNLIKEKV